ncbi:MAG TPA: hypothetical protein VGH02_09645 [Rhizomicrobium sp.]
MSSQNEIGPEELDRLSFYWFAEAMRILALEAEDQCNEMGNYNTPFELQYDVTAHTSLAVSTYIDFSTDQRAEISRICDALRKLPDEAITPKGAKMTTHAGCMAGMGHAAWRPFRKDAARLLASLDPLLNENQEYLFQDIKK